MTGANIERSVSSPIIEKVGNEEQQRAALISSSISSSLSSSSGKLMQTKAEEENKNSAVSSSSSSSRQPVASSSEGTSGQQKEQTTTSEVYILTKQTGSETKSTVTSAQASPAVTNERGGVAPQQPVTRVLPVLSPSEVTPMTSAPATYGTAGPSTTVPSAEEAAVVAGTQSITTTTTAPSSGEALARQSQMGYRVLGSRVVGHTSSTSLNGQLAIVPSSTNAVGATLSGGGRTTPRILGTTTYSGGVYTTPGISSSSTRHIGTFGAGAYMQSGTHTFTRGVNGTTVGGYSTDSLALAQGHPAIWKRLGSPSTISQPGNLSPRTLVTTGTTSTKIPAGGHIISEKIIEREMVIPKKILREDTIEKVVVIPERVIHEEVVDDVKKYKEKIVEVGVPVYKERIMEYPEYECRYKTVEVPEIIVREKIKQVPKISYKERIIEIPKIYYQEKIVEVADVTYRDVPKERIVEVPEIREQIVTKEVPVPQYVDKPIAETIEKTEHQDVERKVPVPIEAVMTVELHLPSVRTKYTKVDYPVYAPKFIEVAIPADCMDQKAIVEAEAVYQQLCTIMSTLIASVSRNVPSSVTLAELEGLANAARSIDAKAGPTNIAELYMSGQVMVDGVIGRMPVVTSSSIVHPSASIVWPPVQQTFTHPTFSRASYTPIAERNNVAKIPRLASALPVKKTLVNSVTNPAVVPPAPRQVSRSSRNVEDEEQVQTQR